MSDLTVRLDELVASKTLARELPRQLDRLERGDVEKLVITRRNAPRAVLLTLDSYEALLGESPPA